MDRGRGFDLSTDVALREGFARNEVACEISAFATYSRLCATLRALDKNDAGQGGFRGDHALLRSVLGEEPLGVSEDTMRVVEAPAERRVAQIEKPPADTFVMGDLWPGNVLVNVGEEEDEGDGQGSQASVLRFSSRPTPALVVVVDWELTKAGLAGLDVGQFCAELATLRRLRPDSGGQRCAEAAGETLASFVRAYSVGDVNPEADETRRVALGHLGVHLAVWTPRTGWDGEAGPTRTLMLDGGA